MGEKELRDARKSLNVNDEYLSTLRTKSYLEISSKAQVLANEPSSPYNFQLVEPCQDTISSILESAILAESPEFKTLILDYFDVSAEASKICGHLLTKINQIQRNYQFIQRALDSLDEYHHSPEKFRQILSELNSFVALKTPFSNPNKHDFKMINEKYSSILHHLRSKKSKVSRKIKMIKFIHTASGICLTSTCGLIVVIAIVIAVHTLAPLLMAPAILSFVPVKLLKKKKTMIFKKLPCLKCGFLRKVGDQLDVASQGDFHLNWDFDTMSRMVLRMNDEVEHKKEIIRTCLERQREDHRFCQQIVKELNKCNSGFWKQVQELEEHVYLCLVAINRARALVIKEMGTYTYK
ncbi:UDP-Glycosyltransferase superfamily protein isoform 1 [Hibiscus syriacus]|uniref:UDP-Glycosyltransferase superfamily protein isoform 1 n=1 Tax=Hibiscus syriacus TaxID=106335 RepID=A0A6A2X1C2_HIBSY|nr:UPF0496 protein At1g20180-like [Hibiscus syriacus]KAE8668472.1 UDP-Glycosyltransferase superfamily protein isoform 1 [Hibiscus syriacus]